MHDTFIPRKFEALVDEYGLDDFGSSGYTFKVQSIKKGKIYEERNPNYISGHQKGVIIDDNCCWWHYGTSSFKSRFKEVSRESKIDEILN